MEEVDRIRLLPERDWHEDIDVLVRYLTNKYKTPKGEQVLHPHQAAALAYLHDYKGLVAPLPVGSGKAQPDTEPVLTVDGWVEIGKLQVGDRIFGRDGAIHQVMGVFPQGLRPTYRLSFSDGTYTDCDVDHIWHLRRQGNVGTKKEWYNYTVRELLDTKLYREAPKKAHKIWQFFLPMAQPIQYPHQDLPLDPYTLGALIGDGSLKGFTPSFTSMDQDIVDNLALPDGVRIKPGEKKSKATSYYLAKDGKSFNGTRTNPLTAILRELKVDTLSYDKHIPQRYLRASIEQRLALLQGLLDTDGEAMGSTACGFSSVSEQLAKDVQQLGESLGGSCTLVKRTTKPGCGYHYRVILRLPVDMQPFHCERKRKIYWSAKRQRPPGRSLRSIEYIGERSCTCIMTSAPDSLYVTRHHIVTHNTIVSLLSPHMLGAKRPLILVPAALRDKTLHEIDTVYSKHWRLPEHLYIQSYTKLSRDYDNKYLTELKPDFIFCDEAHALANTKSACWKRLKEYLVSRAKAGHRIPVAFTSGTLMNRDLKEYWHLLRVALGDMAPVPSDWRLMQQWSDAMSAKLSYERPDPDFLHCLGKNDRNADPVTRARQAFGDRLSRTPGILMVEPKTAPYSLEVHPYWVELPEDLSEYFEKLRSEWLTPDDYPLEYPMQLWAHARQLATGFFYRYDPRPPQGWLNARRDWSMFVLEKLDCSRTWFSPGQVADAIRRGVLDEGKAELDRWEKARAEYTPNQEAVWVDDTVLHEAATWIGKHKKGIVWCEHLAFAQELGKLVGMPVFGQGGCDVESGAPLSKHKGPLIATLACATGQNLQRYNHNLIVSATPTGKLHEQLIGRTHRFGQESDTVFVDYVLACKEQFRGFWQAYKDSEAQADGRFTPDAKLRIATITVPQVPELTGSAWK